MRNLKRALCLALASVMVLGMTVIGASAATASDFTDYDSVEEKEALDVMAAIDVIEGTEAGAFNPEGHFTREQAAKILSVMLLGSGNADKLNNNAQIFKDVASGKWSAGYIAYCSNVGIIAGDGQGNFNPEGELDAVSFGKMLLVALGYDPAKEGYINNPGWQQSISGDMIEAGIDVKDVKFDDILTREQATVMAFKAIQTPLVEYANYLDPSKANYVTTTVAKTQTISSQKLSNSEDYTIEFGEKYQPDLVKSGDGTEPFYRPAHKWTYESEKIGRYNDTPDLTYTTEVTNGQIYSDLGLSEKILVANGTIRIPDENEPNNEDKAKYYSDSQYFIDGAPVYYDSDNDEYVSDYTKEVLAIENKDDIKLGGNGTLTEVYFHDVSYSDSGEKIPAWAEIVSVNTYVGDVTAKADNTSTHDAYITVTSRYDKDADPNTNNYEDNRPKDSANKPVELDTFDTEDFALGDVVLFTYSFKDSDGVTPGIKSVKVADVVTGKLTAYTSKERAAVDDESYSYSNKIAKEAHPEDLKFDVIFVLDEYGYAIDVDPVGLNTGYAVILNKNKIGDFADTSAVKLLLTDGTVVNTALLSNSTTDDVADVDIGDIVSYTIDNRDRYILKVVADINTINRQATTKSVVEIENGEYQIKQIAGNGEIKAGGNTIFLVRDVDSKGDDVYTAYNGIKNVPDIKTASATDVTVFCEKDNTVATVIYIDVANVDKTINTSDEDYVYVKFDPKVVAKYDTVRGWYYHYQAIVSGEDTYIDIDPDSHDSMKFDGEYHNTLFTTVRKDENDIYSLDTPYASEADGIERVANDALGLLSTNEGYKSYIAAEDCDVFFVDKKGAITEIAIPSVTDDSNDHVWYITDTANLLTCVFIEEV